MLVILLLSLFLLTYSIYNEFVDKRSAQKRIKTLDNFLLSSEQDMNRGVYIAGFRSIFIMESKIAESGNYISSAKVSAEELIMNGTLYNEAQPLMTGATLPEIISSLNEKAQKVNANITLTQTSLNVTQTNPWKVRFTLNVKLKLIDKGGLAFWEKNESFSAEVPITNFDDPLYIVSTAGVKTNKITKTPYQIPINGNDVTNLTAHATNYYYTSSSLAPSFLNRLSGNMTADQNGIESLINLQDLASKGISVKDKTIVDYIYFSSDNPSSSHIIGTPSWFKLDQPHLAVYGVQNITG